MFLMNWIKIINANILKYCMPFFPIKMILFSMELWLVLKHAFRTAIVNVQFCDSMLTKFHKTSQRRNSTKKKVMVTAWWSSVGLILHSFIEPGETITAEKYFREIHEIHHKLTRRQPALGGRVLFFSMTTLDRMFQWALVESCARETRKF